MNTPTKICTADHFFKMNDEPGKVAAEMQRIADAVTSAIGGARVRWVWDPTDPDNVVGWYELDVEWKWLDPEEVKRRMTLPVPLDNYDDIELPESLSFENVWKKIQEDTTK